MRCHLSEAFASARAAIDAALIAAQIIHDRASQVAYTSRFFDPAPLHLFVVTLRCEHSCPYCQVSRRSVDRERFDMSEEIALRAFHVALSAPARRIKIEFQGGEPLLNFELVRTIVGAVRERAPARNKTVEFVIASNLALLTDEVLAFCRDNDILLSTSLDGPADLHNRNRPRPGGNSHELAVAGIRRAQAVLGRCRVGALMTTTEASLKRVEEIVDEYLRVDCCSPMSSKA